MGKKGRKVHAELSRCTDKLRAVEMAIAGQLDDARRLTNDIVDALWRYSGSAEHFIDFKKIGRNKVVPVLKFGIIDGDNEGFVLLENGDGVELEEFLIYYFEGGDDVGDYIPIFERIVARLKDAAEEVERRHAEEARGL